MHLCLFVLCILSSVPSFSLSYSGELDILDGPITSKWKTRNIPNSLKFLGSYGTKSYFAAVNITLPWIKAWQFCRDHDMHLPSIESAPENHFVVEFLKPEGLNKDWWLSGTDVTEEGKFIWMSTGKEFSYSAWKPGVPDNFKGDEHCAVVGTHTQQIFQFWNDDNCSKSFSVFCEAS